MWVAFQQHNCRKGSDTINRILYRLYTESAVPGIVYTFDPLVIPLPTARMFALGSICFTYTTYYNM